MDNLKTILGIVLIEKTERRILVTYNGNGSLSDPQTQRDFERSTCTLLNSLYEKAEGETHVLTVEGRLIVVNIYSDFYMLIAAEEHENEVVLLDLLNTIHGAALVFCGKEVETKLVYRFFPEMALMLNEVFDNGLVLCTSSSELVARVLMKDANKGTAYTPNQKGSMMSFFNFAT